MWNNLVGDRAVVLEDVEVRGVGGFGELLCDGLFNTNHVWLARSVCARPEAVGDDWVPVQGSSRKVLRCWDLI